MQDIKKATFKGNIQSHTGCCEIQTFFYNGYNFLYSQFYESLQANN